MPQYNRYPNTFCLVCNKPIYKRPSQIVLNHGRVFCSSNCYGFSCRQERPCPICGKPILAGLKKKTCSRTCANKNRVGVKYNLFRKKDKVKSYKSLKLRLLFKRGNVCERCGYNRYEILQVHHKDRDRTHNDLDNLELICPNCHYEEHLLEKSWLKKKIVNLGEVA